MSDNTGQEVARQLASHHPKWPSTVPSTRHRGAQPAYSAFWVPRSAIFIAKRDPAPGEHCLLLGLSHGHSAGRYIWKPNQEGLKRRQTPKSISGSLLEAGWSPLSAPCSCGSLLLTTLPAVLRTAPPARQPLALPATALLPAAAASSSPWKSTCNAETRHSRLLTGGSLKAFGMYLLQSLQKTPTAFSPRLEGLHLSCYQLRCPLSPSPFRFNWSGLVYATKTTNFLFSTATLFKCNSTTHTTQSSCALCPCFSPCSSPFALIRLSQVPFEIWDLIPVEWKSQKEEKKRDIFACSPLASDL